MKKSIVIALFIISICQALLAQTPKEEVSVASVKGVFCTAIGTKKGVAGIKIKIPAYTPDIVKFVVDWNDGQVKTYDVNYPKSSKDTSDIKEHEYNLTDCMYDKEFLIRVIVTYAPSTNKADWRVPTSVFFTNPPSATILANPSPACVGQKVNFNLKLCPDKNATSKISFGDNSQEESNSNHFYTHSYKGVGFYTVNVWSSNSCSFGVPTLSTYKIEVIDEAMAMIADSGATRQIGKDTVLVCMNKGKAIIGLDGSSSTSENKYYWSGSGFKYLNYTNENYQKPLIEFNGPGIYTVYLEVDNACNKRSKKVAKIYKVLDLPTLTIAQPEDLCKPTTFIITNPVVGATYTINGEPLLATGKFLDYSDKPYILEGKLQNVCTDTPVSIQKSFTIQKAKEIKILFPKDTTICVGTNPIKLTNNLNTNQWSSNNINFDGLFKPQNTGSFIVKTENGTGNCLTKDSVRINIIGTTVQVQDETVCGKSVEFVKLNPSIPNGIFSVLDCPSCHIKSDSLFFSGILQNQISISYTVEGISGCIGNTTAKITISNPKINKFELKDGCDGVALSVDIQVSGTNIVKWYQNNNVSSFFEGLNPAIKLEAGTHMIRVEAGSGTCLDTKSKTINITKAPEAFKITKKILSGSNCSPITVQLEADIPEQKESKYYWYKDNQLIAQTFHLPNQILTNEKPNNQNVVFKLLQENTCGIKDEIVNVEILAKAKARLGIDSLNYRCSPANVVLTDYSLPNIGKKYLSYDGKVVPFEVDRMILPLQAKGDSVTTYFLSLILDSGCNIDTSTVEVKVYPSRIRMAYNMSATKLCINEKLILKDITPSGWAGEIEWRFSDGERLAGREIEKSFSKAGIYWIKQVMKLGCVKDSLERQIIVTELPKINAVLLTPTICQGQKFEAIYKGNNPFVWTFDTKKDSSRFSFSQTLNSFGIKSIYLSIFGDTRACRVDTVLKVSVRAIPILKNVIAPEFICSNGTITLKAEMIKDASKFDWKLTNGLRKWTLGGSNPSVNLPSGIYDVGLKFSDGVCADSTEYLSLFTVDSCTIGIPEVFTPNGDTSSERFTVFGSKGVLKINYLKVFDSWGKIIYLEEDLMPNNFDRAWDGTNYSGKPVATGTYAYQTSLQLVGIKEPVYKTGVIRVVR